MQIEPSEQNVAITGSPNTSTEINFDVRDEHLHTPLLGSLLSLDVPVQDHGSTIQENLMVLGQVASIETENRWHEDASLKNYIKLHGSLPHLTGIGDITTGKLQIIGAYRKTNHDGKLLYKKTRLAVPPGSGLNIDLVGRKTIQDIMKDEFGYAFLGNFYGRNDVPAPVYVRHFGDYKLNGTGEAYMGGVFGPSGSGKSVIAASLVALWAHNPQMGVLILDPQSEFSSNAFARGTSFNFDFHHLLQQLSGNRFDPKKHLIALDQLQLEGPEMFVQVLNEKGFFDTLGVKGKLPEILSNIGRLLEGLKSDQEWNEQMTWDVVAALNLTKKKKKGQTQAEEEISFADLFANECANAYAASSKKNMETLIRETLDNNSSKLQRTWDETVAIFSSKDEEGNQRHRLEDIIKGTLLNGDIRILDLNPAKLSMEDDFKLYLMDFVFRRMKSVAYRYYKNDNAGNCLVVLDEAGRFIPQNTGDNALLERLCTRISSGVKEMRKLRCGFMFITQTIAEIQKDIYRNLHFRIYGVGLGIGADADHIKAKEGEDAYELYRALPDPRLSGTYSYMVAGVLIALGSSGRPMVIEGFSSGQKLIEENPHILASVNTLSDLGIGQAVEW